MLNFSLCLAYPMICCDRHQNVGGRERDVWTAGHRPQATAYGGHIPKIRSSGHYYEQSITL